jgi:ribonuclease R
VRLVPAGRRKPAPFPSKQDVLRFIEESAGRVGKREIARAFRISGQDRIALKRLIRELQDDGLLRRAGKRRVVGAGTLPTVCVVEIAEIDLDGELLARPVRWDGDEAPPQILMAPGAPGARGVAALGIGDRVLARLRRADDGGYEARAIRLLDAGPRQVLGVFEPTSDGGRIHPADRRARKSYVVAEGESLAAKPGEIVRAEALPGRRLGLPRAKITERLGAIGAPRSISLLAIHSHGIPTEFSSEALAQAATAAAPGAGDRADLRSIPLITIDGPDARDFDDAVWAEHDRDADNPGGWHAIVAIADVAHFVRPADVLDGEARERGNSVYLPDRVVPMLPEALSNGLCSLNAGEDRPCLAAHLWLSAEGKLRRHRFERGLMRSAARLTYDQVQKVADGHEDAVASALRETAIEPLYGAYKALRAARRRRGSLEIELPERRVRFAEDGSVADILPEPRFDSHRLIEELMIAANVAAAETLEAKGVLCMYRVHDQPDLAKLESLRPFLAGLGFKLSRSRAMRPENFNQILRKAADSPHAHLINMVILRAQSQAEYNPRNIGHFGLGLRRYAHFTSPIRRYADLLVHRALITGLSLGSGGLPKNAAAGFEAVATHISRTERRAALAERDAMDRYAAAYLAERVGAVLPGRIAGVTRFGLFVELDETGADGLVPASTLGHGRPRHDAERHCLTVDGRRLSLGERVAVRLADADAVSGGLVLDLVEHEGRPRPSGRRAKRS